MRSSVAPQNVLALNNLELSPAFRDLFARFLEQVSVQARTEVQSHLDARISEAVGRAAAMARDAARKELAEELNQAVRRLRECARADDVWDVLAASTAPFCDRAAVYSVSGDMLRGESVRGLDPLNAERLRELAFDIQEAGAFAGVVETREPVVALASSGEIGTVNLELFGHPADDRVYLFPVLSRQSVVGVLYAASESREVEIAALEMLAVTASAALDALAAVEPPAPVKIQPALVALEQAPPAAVQAPDWTALPRADQEPHLRAQRLARVLAAEIRLYQPDAVRSGRARRDLYSALRQEVEGARETFRRECMAACPSMIDYLHLELVGSLANGDARLFGLSYPGPLRPLG
jgi:predicted RecB family endonuclease